MRAVLTGQSIQQFLHDPSLKPVTDRPLQFRNHIEVQEKSWQIFDIKGLSWNTVGMEKRKGWIISLKDNKNCQLFPT
jgi:hypothetical protein